jgi:hypothetical protein
VKGWKNICQANESPKQAGIAIFVFDKVYFKYKLFRRQRKSLYTNQDGIITVNSYEPNASTPNYINKHC